MQTKTTSVMRMVIKVMFRYRRFFILNLVDLRLRDFMWESLNCMWDQRAQFQLFQPTSLQPEFEELLFSFLGKRYTTYQSSPSYKGFVCRLQDDIGFFQK